MILLVLGDTTHYFMSSMTIISNSHVMRTYQCISLLHWLSTKLNLEVMPCMTGNQKQMNSITHKNNTLDHTWNIKNQ